MNFIYKNATIEDLEKLRMLGAKSWEKYRYILSTQEWENLYKNINDENTYRELLYKSECIICSTEDNQFIGMAFLVPSGNPTVIYHEDWCYIRFVSVDPDYDGRGIGTELTVQCINRAKQSNEKIIALHTSEIMETAIHIYKKLGFNKLKEIDKRYGKKYWLYTLSLNKN